MESCILAAVVVVDIFYGLAECSCKYAYAERVGAIVLCSASDKCRIIQIIFLVHHSLLRAGRCGIQITNHQSLDTRDTEIPGRYSFLFLVFGSVFFCRLLIQWRFVVDTAHQ